jgi:hypothetical protein
LDDSKERQVIPISHFRNRCPGNKELEAHRRKFMLTPITQDILGALITSGNCGSSGLASHTGCLTLAKEQEWINVNVIYATHLRST